MNRLLEKLTLLEAGIISAFEEQKWERINDLDDAINIASRELMAQIDQGAVSVDEAQAMLARLQGSYKALLEKANAMKSEAGDELNRLNQEQRAIKHYLKQYKS